MGNDIATGAAYGILVPLAMPFVAYWSRKFSYWVFFIAGTVSVPGFAFVSSAIQGSWSTAVSVVLPRIFAFDGIAISLGFGVVTVILVGIIQISVAELPEKKREAEQSPTRRDQEKNQLPKSE